MTVGAKGTGGAAGDRQPVASSAAARRSRPAWLSSSEVAGRVAIAGRARQGEERAARGGAARGAVERRVCWRPSGGKAAMLLMKNDSW